MTSHFDQFCERQAPPMLRDGDPPPQWLGAPFGWEELRDLARERWRREMAWRFCEQLSRGWTSAELAAGQLTPGSQTTMGGSVVRPAPMAHPALRQRAMRVLQDAAGLPPNTLDPLLDQACREVAYEAGGGTSQGVEAQVTAAEAAIDEWRAREAAKQRQLQGDRVVVDVAYAFRGAARSWQAGEQVVTASEWAALESWRAQMEAQARQHQWSAPDGFAGKPWPPFVRAAASVAALAP